MILFRLKSDSCNRKNLFNGIWMFAALHTLLGAEISENVELAALYV